MGKKRDLLLELLMWGFRLGRLSNELHYGNFWEDILTSFLPQSCNSQYRAIRSQLYSIFVFPWFGGMVMYANEFETKEKQKRLKWKKWTEIKY